MDNFDRDESARRFLNMVDEEEMGAWLADAELEKRIRKVQTLAEHAATDGERAAAEAALRRLREKQGGPP